MEKQSPVTSDPITIENGATGEPTEAARAPLRQRIFQSGSISILGFGASQVIRLASNLVMTRLLTSDAFGLMAITISLQVLMIMISDVGINTSVIRSTSSHDTRFLSTAWVTQIGRGILIAIIMLCAAAVIGILASQNFFNHASVFADPRLPVFVACIAFGGLLEGLRSIKMVLCQRDLKMERLIGLEISSQILAVIAMITAYYLGAGAFSLVIGALTSTCLTSAGSYLFLKGPAISFDFDRGYFNEIFSFGKWLVIASFAAFLTQRGDHFIFGAVMQRDDYGFYAIATIWITAVIILTDIIQTRIVYTSFSEVWRERPQDLTPVYRKFRLGFDVCCLSVFIGIHLFADFAFNILYPDSYGNVVDYLKLLSVIILFLPYRLLNSAMLAEGKSRNFMFVMLTPVVMMIVLTPIIYHYTDLRTAIVFSTLAQLPMAPMSWYFSRGIIKLSALQELPMLLVAIVTASIFVFS